MNKAIENRVREIVADVLRFELDDVKTDSSFVHDLGAEEIDVPAVVIAVEREFGTEISNEKAARIATVGDLVKIIEAQVLK